MLIIAVEPGTPASPFRIGKNGWALRIRLRGRGVSAIPIPVAKLFGTSGSRSLLPEVGKYRQVSELNVSRY